MRHGDTYKTTRKLSKFKHLNETWTQKLLFVSHAILEFLRHKIFVKIYNLINFECFPINSLVNLNLFEINHCQVDF